MIKLNTKSVSSVIAGLVVALTLVIASSASAAEFLVDLTVGSTGPDVTALQNFLISNGGTIPAGPTGVFGAQTKAAVAAYQSAKGIVPASGYFGALTRASVNASTVVVVGQYPAGCTSVLGFSTITGASCAGSTVSGCAAGALFSATTGASCTGGSNPSTGGLSGNAGDLLTPVRFTSGIENIVAEDSSEKVLGVELEASDDSDLAITSMKLTLVKATGASASTRLDRYVDSVSIMQGSEEVASVDASDFTKNSTAYSKSVSLSDAVVKAGEKSKFYFVVKTVSSIDSAYDRGATWTATLTQTRYKDASGAFLTDDTDVSDTFGFESVTANDKITLLASSANPATSNVQVDDVNVSEDFMLLAFKLKAATDSSDLNVLTIPVAVEITSASTTSFTSEELINDIWLEVGGTTYNDFDNTVITVATTTATTTTYTFNIDAGDLEIAAGNTEEVKVYANFGSQENNYVVGTKVKASITGAIEVENIDGDSVASPTNDIVGNYQTVQLQGINFSLKSVTAAGTSVSGEAPYVVVTMPLQITTDEILYVLKNATATAMAPSVTSALTASTTVQFVNGSNTPTIVTSGGNDYYQIDGTKTLYVEFIVNGSASGTVKSFTTVLGSVTASTELGGDTVVYDLSPESSFSATPNLRY